AEPVRFVDRGLHLVAGDERVELEPGGSLTRPVAYDAARILGCGDRVHAAARTISADVRPGHVHARPGSLPLVDLPLEVELAVRRHAAGRTDRCDAAREVEARGGEIRLDAAAGRRIEGVVVHPDDAGDDGVSGEVNDPCAGGYTRAGGRAHGGDPYILDDDGLALAHRRAGPVDDTDVGKGDDRLADGHHRLCGAAELVIGLRTGGLRDEQACGECCREAKHRALLMMMWGKGLRKLCVAGPAAARAAAPATAA